MPFGLDQPQLRSAHSRRSFFAWMARMPQKELGPYIRETLIARHGSLAFAAERLGISYDRLKKAIQRNRFSAPDLELMLPGRSYESLLEEFDFDFSRRQAEKATAGRAGNEFDLFLELEPGFRSFQRGVRDTDFNAFVSDMYMKIGSTAWTKSMVLFCHETSQPVEWRPEQIQLLKQLAAAIKRGASIFYIMECDLENTVTPRVIEEDNIDRHFRRHVERLKSLCKDDHAGFVALLRVPRCAFCIPYQKPALFSRYGPDLPSAEHHALTTVEIPERADGKGYLGAAVLPQSDEVAHAMRDYIFDLVGHIRAHRLDQSIPFHFQCYPTIDSMSDFDELISRLQPIVEL